MAVIMTDAPADMRQGQDQGAPEIIHAYCDICDAEYHASKELLRRMGWTFGPGYEICPNHD